MSERTKGKITTQKYRGLDAIYLNGKCVCKIAISEFTYELIRRWNSHDDLLAACEEAEKALNLCLRYFLGTGPQPNPDDLTEAPIKLRAAIAKGEERIGK